MVSAETQTQPSGWIVAAAAAAAATIFICDLLAPVGYAVWLLYVLPLWLTSLAPGIRGIPIAISVVLGLLWGEVALSPGKMTALVISNRALASVLLCVIGWLVFNRKRLAEQREAAQAALRLSEERFRALVQASSDVVYRISSDWTEMRHLVGRDFIADTLEPSQTWLQKYIPPGDQKHLMATINEAIRLKSVFELEHRVLRTDGTLGWTFLRAIPILDAAGEITEWFGMASDVTARKQAEETVRASDERLQLAMEIGQMAAWDWNISENTVTYSPTLGPLFGLPAGTRHNTYEEFIHAIYPDDRERINRAITLSLETGRLFSEEYRTVWPNGTVRWLSDRGRVYRDQTGKPARMIGILLDITLRREAEEAMRDWTTKLEQRVKERTTELTQANERFDWVARATNDGVWDWDLVHDTVYFSPRWKVMHGFQESEGPELTKEWQTRIHPEERPSVVASLERYLRGEQGDFWEEEYRIQRKDGDYFWVLDRSIAIRDEQGRAVRMVGADTDISWRKGIEQALRLREQQFHTLADNVPALFSYVDLDRRYQFLNKRYEELFDRGDDELRGMSVEDLLGSEGYAQVRPFLDQALVGQSVSFEYTLKLPGNGTRHLVSQYVPDRNDQGQVVGVFVLMTDVTALKTTEGLLREREAQLRELGTRLLQAQEEERRRISRDLHDDVMQRMGALTLELYGLASSISSQDVRLQSQLTSCGASAEQLTTDLQRIAHQLHPSALEFGGLETAVRDHVNEFAARTGISAELMTHKVPKDIPLDQATCLYRVLQEGLQNVQKHAEATTVLVRLLRTGRGVGLCIHDDGRGIENSDGAARRRGLGLTSMAERVGMLNGTFRILTNQNGGTELHAWVPLELKKMAMVCES